MASASKSTTLYSGNGYPYTLTASFNENGTSVANNTSNITCTATFSAGSTYWSTSYPSTLTIYWHDNRENYDRQVASITFSGIDQYGSKTASGTINVTHKDDGTLSGYAYAYFNKGSTTTAWACNSGGVSTDWTNLTTIARASQPTISPSTTFNIGDTITINTNRKSTAFTHTVTLYFGNYSYQIATGVTDSVSFNTSTIANDMYQQIPNASVGEGNVTVVTYNGSTQIGSKSVIFNAKVTNSDPTFNQEYLDINTAITNITGNNQWIVRNKSNLEIVITNAEAKNYATLSSTEAIINGVTYTGEFRGYNSTIDVGTLNLSSNVTAQVSVIDSRGIKTTKNLNITILDWVQPSAIINLERENNYYSETNINVNAEYSSLNNVNTISIKVREKKTGTSTWSAYTTLQDEVTAQLTLDNNYAWDVQVVVQDQLATTTYNLTLDRGIPILYIDREKRSLGIDCFPQDSTSLEINGENILSRIAGYGQIANQVTGDWNTACGTASGIYMGENLLNSPTGATVSGWWWVIHIVHNANYQRQIAYSFLNNSQVFTRIMNNGTWNNWTLLNEDVQSTSEITTNKTWIDGKPVYRKVLELGSVSAGGTISKSTGISDLDNFISLTGTAKSNSSNNWFPVPRAHNNSFSYQISLYYNGGNGKVEIETSIDLEKSYVILEYTKTTD